jgi:signal transduction histidine kinase
VDGRDRRAVPDGGSDPDALFESFPDPLVAYAAEPPVVRAINPAFATTFDVEPDEAAGTPLDEFVLPGTMDGASGPIDEASADGDPDGEETPDAGDPDGGTGDSGEPTTTTAGALLDRVRPPDGTGARLRHASADGTRYFRVRASAPGNADGAGYLLFTDVTGPERRRRDLATNVARLERFASVASHDLRNPLEVAKIRLEAARDTGEDVHFEKVEGALDRIERIVRDVLAVGGGGVDPTDSVALDAVARAGWDTVDTADASLDVATGLATVRGDADRLQQLFENLFRNAIEHGGRDVTVTVEPVPDGFAVVDDGPGIPPDARERAFEAGYSTASGNSGLGLAIVREIAGEHGWQVSLASDEGTSTDDDGGARFEFTGVDQIEEGNGSSGASGASGSSGSDRTGRSDGTGESGRADGSDGAGEPG